MKDFLVWFTAMAVMIWLLHGLEQWMEGVTTKLDKIVQLLERGR